MKAVKTIAALLFLTVMAIVLVQPVLGADDGPPPSRGSAVGETTGPDEDDGDGEAEGEEGVLPPVDMTAFYPGRCLDPVDAPATGLVAARRGSSVSVGAPDGEPVARFGVEGDAAWSPSGRYLLEGGGELFDDRGTPLGSMSFRPAGWQWSPVADCVLATTGSGNLTFGIPETNRKGVQLVSVPVEEFELSPNGRRLAFVARDRGLWIAELREARVRQVVEGRASLVGWFSNSVVLYSKSPGSGKLRYATGRGKTRIVKDTLASSTLERCGDRTLRVSLVDGSDAPLAEIVSDGGRLRAEVLGGTAAPSAALSGAACSPDGGFIVASTLTIPNDEKGPLVLLQSDGTFVREIVPGRTANPTWTSQGLMFVKFGPARGRLWFVPPNGAPAPTAYTVGAPNQYDWHSR